MKDLLSCFGLAGQYALVTGARSGIGQAAALALAAAGADVIGLGSSPMPETRRQIEGLGRRFHFLQANLEEAHDFRALIDAVEREAGPLGILVNSAGMIRRAELLDASEDEWDQVLTVNAKSLFFLSQAAARAMAERSYGRIVNIASLLSFQGGIRVPSYTASKHAVAGLTKAMANELAPHGVTVNAIAPGYIETANTAELRADEDRSAAILSRIPLGRWGTSADMQSAVLFLAAPASSYVTGTILAVDGGWLAR